ncbi:MAG: Ku protein [Rhizobacter sp.]|nr:Ku protein [Burkholderiales bacterium]
MPRSVWKGAISFGLIHVPVSMFPATQDSGVDFDWLDRRSLDPVGYSRVNKRTNKPIEKDDVVKGVKTPDGSYAIIEEDEIKAAYPRATQSIEIETFVKASEVSFAYLDTPYYLQPDARSTKVYALLRESMKERKVIAVARVVMRSKEHLALLLPLDDAIVLNTIRWNADMREVSELALPKGATGVKDSERKMASQLIDDMTATWQPALYTDRFVEAIRALVANRVKAGDTSMVAPIETDTTLPSSNVIDLTELLRNSLKARDKSARTESSKPEVVDKVATTKQPAVSALRSIAKKTTKQA